MTWRVKSLLALAMVSALCVVGYVMWQPERDAEVWIAEVSPGEGLNGVLENELEISSVVRVRKTQNAFDSWMEVSIEFPGVTRQQLWNALGAVADSNGWQPATDAAATDGNPSCYLHSSQGRLLRAVVTEWFGCTEYLDGKPGPGYAVLVNETTKALECGDR